MGEGIASDIFYLFLNFIREGRGFSRSVMALVDGNPHPLAPDCNYILYALTVVNQDSVNSVNIGVGGVANILLPPGASYTFRMKNPVKAQLVYSSASSVRLDLIS